MTDDPALERLQSGAAWDVFCDTLKAAGRMVASDEAPADPLDRAQGYRFLTRLLRHGLDQFVEFGDPDFPVFYEPSNEIIKISSDNPDTQHFMAALRGDREYVIEGRRGTVHRVVFTTLGPNPNGAGLAVTGALQGADLAVGPDDRYTVTVSKVPQARNWLPMTDTTTSVLIRAIFLDRRNETPLIASIRRTSSGPSAPTLAPTEFPTQLQRAAALVGNYAALMLSTGKRCRERGWINRLGEEPLGAGDPSVRYLQGWWALANDEALVIRFTPPRALFWNFQVNNCWMESLDYRYHRIHINKGSAHYEADGSVRIIVAARDPGLPNWLTTDGLRQGTMVSRWTDSESCPDMSAHVMKRSDLHK